MSSRQILLLLQKSLLWIILSLVCFKIFKARYNSPFDLLIYWLIYLYVYVFLFSQMYFTYTTTRRRSLADLSTHDRGEPSLRRTHCIDETQCFPLARKLTEPPRPDFIINKQLIYRKKSACHRRFAGLWVNRKLQTLSITQSRCLSQTLLHLSTTWFILLFVTIIQQAFNISTAFIRRVCAWGWWVRTTTA